MQFQEGDGNGLWQPDAGSEDPELQQQLERFLQLYPCDERAVSLLMNLPSPLLLKVINTFDPRNKEEVDYSRQVTGFIRSLRMQEEAFGQLRKRGLDQEEEPGANKRIRSWTEEAPAPSEEDIAAFRDRYPMDERALEYLTSSPAAAQHKVLSEFKPRNEGEPDYSSLITSLVKKARQTVSAGPPWRGHAAGAGGRASVHGPSLEQLRAFRDRFPMDERAWEYLLNANASAQEVVITDFKPRRYDDEDYSAPVTAFVRSMTNRARGLDVDLPPCPAKLELFRERFPMDERAFQYLCSATPEMQREVLASFSPKNMDETDFSRQLTGFLNRSVRYGEAVGTPPHLAEDRHRRIDWRSVPDIREVGSQRRGGYEDPGRSTGLAHRSRYGGNGREGRLEEFRAQYPMDDRAFDYLLQADREVQDTVLAEFQPKRRHLDGDYSASVTSYTKAVKNRALSAPLNDAGYAQPDAGLSSGEQAMLDGFRRRYPMDDRAFQFLCIAEPAVKQKVMESFRPKFEGEADYSGLITPDRKSVV